MEKKLKITFSASNEETVSVGEFSITLYEALEDKEIMHQITDMALDQISINELKSFSITIE